MYLRILLVFLLIVNLFVLPAFSEQKKLNFADAYSGAIKTNPELLIFQTENKIADAYINQSKLTENPYFKSLLENIGGNSDITGGSQLTMSINQLLEFSDKVDSRVKLASFEKERIKIKLQQKKNKIRGHVFKTFTEVLSAQEQYQISKEALDISKKIYKSISDKVDTGKVNPIEKVRAKLSLSIFQIEFDKSYHNLNTLKKSLSFITGETFDSVKADFYKMNSLPTLSNILDETSESPQLAMFPIRTLVQFEIINNEKLKVRPDVNLNVGYRVFDISKSANISLLAGVSIPVPIFNANQGNIAAAEYEIQKIKAEKNILEFNLKDKIIKSYSPLITAYTELIQLKEIVVPTAEKVFNSINETYLLGQLNYLDVLEAQKVLFQSKSQYIKSISNYRKALAEIEIILGKEI